MKRRERYRRAKEIFLAVAEYTGSEQAELVARQCQGDAELDRRLGLRRAALAELGHRDEELCGGMATAAGRPTAREAER